MKQKKQKIGVTSTQKAIAHVAFHTDTNVGTNIVTTLGVSIAFVRQLFALINICQKGNQCDPCTQKDIDTFHMLNQYSIQ